MSAATPFDPCGPLPTGTTVLEASAGTGKTFTIAALATRYVAEGAVPLHRLMLVTFGRAATNELRERVRDRLVSTERALADPAAALADGDGVVRLLASGSPAEVGERRRRLTAALATFDAATIATTHVFCRQMLAGLGVAGDSEPGAVLLERPDELVTEIVSDLYIRKYGGPHADAAPLLTYAEAGSVARHAIADRNARLVPATAEEGSAAAHRFGLAAAVRAEYERRKRRRRLLDYDDLLTRLRDALVDEQRGPVARSRIRARFDVVLVDEFQDTDPVQWDILRLAFDGHCTLVLVGDPKQAIYAFRGADVAAYLAAADAATSLATLACNWRSDAPLLHGLGHLFGGAALGDPRIVVRPVDSAHRQPRLLDAPGGAPLRLRVLRREQVSASSQAGLPLKPQSMARVAGDLAGDVVRLLSGAARLQLGGGIGDGQGAELGDPLAAQAGGPPGDGPRGAKRPVRPGDVAVLVRTHEQGAVVRDRLTAVGVPAVVAGTSSVFLTDAARQWLVLLQALERPHSAGRVRAAALTCFLGWSAQQLAAAGDDALNVLGPLFRNWAEVLDSRGVAALLEAITVSQRLLERLLSAVDGERLMTDVRHVGQILHAAAVESRLGITALVADLQRRLLGAKDDAAEARSRRLESDADAVQVVTVHGSKGLEFPVVYVPFGWDRHLTMHPKAPLHLHDGDARILDVGGPTGPGYDERRRTHLAEESGEELRLLYVALTRAQCQVVVWWVPATTTHTSPLHRLLFSPAEAGTSPPLSVPVPSDDEVARILRQLSEASGGTLALEAIADEAPTPWVPAAAPPAPLQAAQFDRVLDTAWRRTSYSALTALAHDAVDPQPDVGSEPEVGERSDEAVPAPQAAPLPTGEPAPPAVPPAAPTPAPLPTSEQALRSVPSPMAELPVGAAFGTLVHRVLEAVDPTAPDLPAELTRCCREAVAARFGTAVDPAALATGLLPVFATPLGPVADDRALRDIPPRDRLAELDFELPLAGGDAPAAEIVLGQVADLLRRRLAPGDPLSDYPDLLDGPMLRDQPLRGYLAGSIDAVLRLPGHGGPRYLVVDYKTNWLGARGADDAEPLTAWDYRPAALADAMLRAHYPLQALLYAVALHRFLRWRQPGYDPGRHLGGVLYLFVRGMAGPATPYADGSPCGVFGWRPPDGLVEELSALLDAGAR